eukprot:TRINITY_DN21026_c0_g1_i1.p1 TRINITY_DN21026_c0_g1~~TRINITY_DN21026_c0_g1_i1.p1  ORF type:complete len:716 (+),score=99.56 TRINITY_DN21026_c0_g1_i1:458-2605(+)
MQTDYLWRQPCTLLPSSCSSRHSEHSAVDVTCSTSHTHSSRQGFSALILNSAPASSRSRQLLDRDQKPGELHIPNHFIRIHTQSQLTRTTLSLGPRAKCNTFSVAPSRIKSENDNASLFHNSGLFQQILVSQCIPCFSANKSVGVYKALRFLPVHPLVPLRPFPSSSPSFSCTLSTEQMPEALIGGKEGFRSSYSNLRQTRRHPLLSNAKIEGLATGNSLVRGLGNAKVARPSPSVMEDFTDDALWRASHNADEGGQGPRTAETQGSESLRTNSGVQALSSAVSATERNEEQVKPLWKRYTKKVGEEKSGPVRKAGGKAAVAKSTGSIGKEHSGGFKPVVEGAVEKKVSKKKAGGGESLLQQKVVTERAPQDSLSKSATDAADEPVADAKRPIRKKTVKGGSDVESSRDSQGLRPFVEGGEDAAIADSEEMARRRGSDKALSGRVSRGGLAGRAVLSTASDVHLENSPSPVQLQVSQLSRQRDARIRQMEGVELGQVSNSGVPPGAQSLSIVGSGKLEARGKKGGVSRRQEAEVDRAGGGVVVFEEGELADENEFVKDGEHEVLEESIEEDGEEFKEREWDGKKTRSGPAVEFDKGKDAERSPQVRNRVIRLHKRPAEVAPIIHGFNRDGASSSPLSQLAENILASTRSFDVEDDAKWDEELAEDDDEDLELAEDEEEGRRRRRRRRRKMTLLKMGEKSGVKVRLRIAQQQKREM